MVDLRMLLAFAGLVAVALAFAERGVRGAFAPVCAVAVAVLAVVLPGCLGVLWLGGLLAYLLAALCAGWVIWRFIVKKIPLPRLGFGFWFFVCAGLAAIFLLWLKQPMFTGWDEFSFWGTAGKLMKTFDEMYTTAPIGWAWNTSQTPALPALSYYFQFWGGAFVEHHSYAACDVFMLAGMAAVLAPFEDAKRHWSAALPAALALLLCPYVFSHYQRVDAVSPVYLDTLADLPMGFAFAAALCCWYGSRGGRAAREMTPLCLALALLVLTKDIAVSLALVVCVLVFIDKMLVMAPSGGLKLTLGRRLGRAFARLGVTLGTVVLAFGGWELYTSLLTGVNRAESGGGKLNVGLQSLPLLFLEDLFSAEKTGFFKEITNGMLTLYIHGKTTLLGSGLALTAGILLGVALAALLTKSKAHRRRCVCYGVFSALGFVCYNVLITLSYLYVLRPEQARSFESYNRYMAPYIIGWLLCALLLLGQTAAERACSGAQGKKWRALRPTAARVALLGLVALVLLRVALLVPPAYTILGVHPSEYNYRRMYAEKVANLCARLEPDGRTFYVNSADNGTGWFTLSYQMLPWQLDYSFGGGELVVRTARFDGSVHKWLITRDEWAEYLAESGCTTVYIEDIDAAFQRRYGALFSDGLAAWHAGATDLYRVGEDDTGTLLLTPIYD